MGTFYSDIREASAIESSTARRWAIEDVIEAWKDKTPIISEALAGHCSFEQTVEPLVKENLRIGFPYWHNSVCCSEEFQCKAKNITESLDGIMSLDTWFISGRLPCDVELVSPVKFPKFSFGVMFLIPLVVSIVTFAFGYNTPDVQTNGSIITIEMLPTFLKWGIIGGCIMMFLQLIVPTPPYFCERRALALRVQTQARFLDETLKKFQNR